MTGAQRMVAARLNSMTQGHSANGVQKCKLKMGVVQVRVLRAWTMRV